MYLNKVILFGNLTRDPEERALPSGMKVATFGLATNRVWRDKTTGQKKEDTQFHNVVVFGRQAELIVQYLNKGSSALIEGRLQTRSWDGQDGVKRYRTEIVADRVQFGPRSQGGSSATGGTSSGSGTRVNDRDSAPPADDTDIAYPDDEISPDDIPF